MRRLKWSLLLAVVLALALVTGGLAAFQAFTPSLPWWTLDSGGGQSEGGGYTLTGTIGQPDAGLTMTGGPYSLSGGYWARSSSTSIYLPLISK